MWKKPEQAQPQEKVAAEFWKPQDRGEVVTGLLKSISDGVYGRYLFFSPVVIYPKEGAPQGYAGLSVGINTWLEKLVTENHVGEHLAIAFQGLRPTPQGKMRTFSVYVISSETWKATTNRDVGNDFLDCFDSGEPIAQDEEEEKLPF